MRALYAHGMKGGAGKTTVSSRTFSCPLQMQQAALLLCASNSVIFLVVPMVHLWLPGHMIEIVPHLWLWTVLSLTSLSEAACTSMTIEWAASCSGLRCLCLDTQAGWDCQLLQSVELY